MQPAIVQEIAVSAKVRFGVRSRKRRKTNLFQFKEGLKAPEDESRNPVNYSCPNPSVSLINTENIKIKHYTQRET